MWRGVPEGLTLSRPLPAAIPVRGGRGVQRRRVLRESRPRSRGANLPRLPQAPKALHASRDVLPWESLQKR